MIEFLLLFALGFLAATLLALIIAPVIHRRIITLTERRMRASVPLTMTEIRAEKDSARATFAAQNAKLAVELRDQRDLYSKEASRNERLQEALAEAHREALEQRQIREEAEFEAGNLRSRIRDHESTIDTLTTELGVSQRQCSDLSTEITGLEQKITWLSGNIEELKIDVAARDTETESFRVQLQSLRDERAVLREQLREYRAVAKEAEARLKREESRAANLDERLTKALSRLSDSEQLLERRASDIANLKERQKQIAERKVTETAEPAAPEKKTPKPAASNGSAKPSRPAKPAPAPVEVMRPTPVATNAHADEDFDDEDQHDNERSIDELVEHLKARQAALTERLIKSTDSANDAGLRREIAEVAALMIELTALREGSASPIRRTLKGTQHEHNPTDIPSLAERANVLLGMALPA